MLNILYFILAAFGLGFLIFIHELGHYFMARRVGMRVEAFGIGFGKPIKTWVHKGVKWNICWLPFGGYVRIAGMEKEGSLEPHLIKDGFFGKKPIDRIKVGIMGPAVNIGFAILLFFIIWTGGGREKPFAEFTHIMGWIDPDSQLYHSDVRPGDALKNYGGHPFEGFSDLQYNSLLSAKTIALSGYEINYRTLEKKPFELSLPTYPDPRALNASVRTVGILNSARYLIYSHILEGQDNPMASSGIQKNDRIVWVDGEFIFSMPQLSHIINENKAFLTIQRGKEILQTRLPKVKVSDIRFQESEKAEISDWQFEAGIKERTSSIYFIAYNLTHDAVVENPLAYLDTNANESFYQPSNRDSFSIALQKGDRILAVDGQSIKNSAELIALLQQKHLQIIVQREPQAPLISWKEADQAFINSFHWEELQKIVSTIGTSGLQKEIGHYHLLNPVTPKPFTALSYYRDNQEAYETELEARKKLIAEIKDPKEKAIAEQMLEESQKRLVLGFIPQDRLVAYNPSPLKLFGDVFNQMARTLKSLVTGSLSPKWMAGPVGIVQVFHYGWSQGIQEALYWMAVISLNLGLINLLPIPVLDGGHILFSFIEMATGKPMKAKTMEKLIVPFVILIIGAFIYFTYNDLMRILSKFWS